ncbi:mitochondrial import inner membrane translocase subunit tim21 [Coemansia aciculifera]|uniref:Mitochondrial import inner membrane translocase subunit tim21 n=1 Tax=Coemansia aciculifera TaxID=417176 RepID=A0ACC1M2V0_9FUNG|nr:mitochondrial import inner membrane translocase subunit tim21 [Coemansia aciculifera]KAJ2893202.1 mitochondrial import inner membrane translocase subunit tim21 [Coemansia aciculifera]
MLSRNRCLSRRLALSSRILLRPARQIRPSRVYSTTSSSKPRTAAEIAGTAGNVLLIGSVATLFSYIMYTLYDNLFAEHGTTRIYNESLDLIRANPQIKQYFGPLPVAGFGEPTQSQRQRQRAIANRQFVDPQGRNRLSMKYYVDDAKRSGPYVGVVKLDLAQSPVTGSWDYNYIVVDLYERSQQQKQSVGRVLVLVTDEFAKLVKDFETERRNHKFTPKHHNEEGAWTSLLNPANWRK